MISKCLFSLLILVVLVPVAHACTAFVVYRNGLALAGNNEDFWLTDTKVWFVPRSGSRRGVAGNHGRVYFGFDNFHPQGGMNEAGLFFDGFATARNEITKSIGKPRFDGNIADHALAECETVAEVVAIFEKHDLSFLANAMLMFGDRHGDSVIIEGDEMLRIDGDHQVVTNFYQSMTPDGRNPCHRYRSAVAALGKGDPVSVETCRDILETTCQKGGAPTQYSNVYDLKKRLVYLYHFHNFEEVVCLDLAKELEKGAHEVDLPSLFPANNRLEEFENKRADQIREKTERRRSHDVDPEKIAECAGTYAFDVGQQTKTQVVIKYQDQSLLATRLGDPKTAEIFPEAQDRFFRFGDYGLETYVFRRDADDQISGLMISLKELDRTYQGERLD